MRVDETDRVISYADIDRAKTVFEWGGQPKPGRQRKSKDELVPKSFSDLRTTAEENASHEADTAQRQRAAEAEPARETEAQ